jgi:ribosomal protein L7/L12
MIKRKYKIIKGRCLEDLELLVNSMDSSTELIGNLVVDGGLFYQAAYVIEEGGMMNEIHRLIQNGRKLEAVKLYKEKKQTGLREAKEFIDSITL